ncbi:MAG: hypothetical protein R6V56_08345 [Lentisphaeria bacterium]
MILLLAILGTPCEAAALTSAEAAVLDRQTVPAVADLGKSISKVPMSAAKILRLPLGALELILSPLPGINCLSATKNIGAGLVAPFELGINVLSLPHRLFTGIEKLTPSIPNTR